MTIPHCKGGVEHDVAGRASIALQTSKMNKLTYFKVGENYTNDEIRFSLDLENLGGIRPALDSSRNLRHVAVLTAADGWEPELYVGCPTSGWFCQKWGFCLSLSFPRLGKRGCLLNRNHRRSYFAILRYEYALGLKAFPSDRRTALHHVELLRSTAAARQT